MAKDEGPGATHIQYDALLANHSETQSAGLKAHLRFGSISQLMALPNSNAVGVIHCSKGGSSGRAPLPLHHTFRTTKPSAGVPLSSAAEPPFLDEITEILIPGSQTMERFNSSMDPSNTAQSPEEIIPTDRSIFQFEKRQNGKTEKTHILRVVRDLLVQINQHTRNPETIRKASRKKPTAVVSREPKQSCTACGLKLEHL